VKYIDEYRDPGMVRGLAARIKQRATRSWMLMEICGGQTHTILRYGLDELLPPEIRLVHGPGCPVCVTAVETIDRAAAVAAQPDVILISYGDMLRVPGSATDLFHVRAAGADVRVAYTPMNALKIARANPGKRVVLLAVGFETTAPATAAVILAARRERLSNLSVLASHVLVPPAIRAILDGPACRIDGFIAPGHVCAVTGFREYEELSAEYRKPIVVGGFEPVDLMEAIALLVDQLEEGRAALLNQYARGVSRDGNLEAQRMMNEVFERCDRNWRGMGRIPMSGLRLREQFACYDAERVFDLPDVVAGDAGACISGLVLQGLRKPTDCAEFGRRCTPASPLGAPMVSSEGACAAYYRYRHRAAAGV
jgi:hydrogenase expression/formation protein HypD